MSRFYGYRHLALHRPEKPQPATKARAATTLERDRDKGTLLILGITAVPTLAVIALALIFAP